MAIEVGELEALLKLRDEMSDKLKDAAKETGAFESVFSGSMGTVMSVAGLAIAAIGGISATIVALGIHGSEVDDVRKAFEHFSGGPDQAAASLAAMREGVRGTVSDLDLTKNAVGLLRAGVVLSADDFSTLTTAAFVLAKQVGGDTKETLDQLTGALETGRTKTVARMLGVVDSTRAEQDYAAHLGVSKDALTDAGKVEAKRLEIMSMLHDAVKDAGDVEMTFADRVKQGEANVKNFVDELSVAVSTSPVVKGAMDFIGDALQNAFGDNQVQTIQTMIGYINSFVIGLIGAGQTALSVAKFFNDAFYGTREIFANILGAVLTLASGLIGLVSTAAEVATHIPGIGDDFKGAAEATKDWKTWIDGARDGLKDYGNEAIDTAGKHDAALGGMNDTLQTLKDKLIEAQKAGADTTEIVNKLGEAHKTAAQTINEWTKVMDAALKKNAEVNATYAAAEAHGVTYTNIMLLMGDGIKELIKNHDLLGTRLPATWGVAIELLTRVIDLQDKERDAVKAVYDELDKRAPDTAKMQIDGYMQGIVAAGKWHDEVIALSRDVAFKAVDDIQRRRDEEIIGLGALKATNKDVYDAMVKQIKDSADQEIAITLGKTGNEIEIEKLFAAHSKESLQGIADNAKNTYEMMRDDPDTYSQDTIAAFRRIYISAQQNADGTKEAWGHVYDALDLGSQILGDVGGKFGEIGKIGIDTFKNIGAEMAKGDLFGAIMAGAAGALKAVTALFGGVSALEQKGRDTEKTFEQSFGSFDAMMGQIGKAYAGQGLSAQQAQTDVLAMMAAEKQGGDAVTAAIQKINDVMNDQKQDAADLDAAIKTYGFSIAELGPTMQRQKLSEQAATLENDFRVLAGSGIDVNTVLLHMGGSINDFLHLAQQTGQEVPAEMQPILQKMVDNKELVDANGKAYTDLSETGVTFSETMTQGFQKVVDKLTDLINKIAGTTGALNAIPKNVTTEIVTNHHDVYTTEGDPTNSPDIPGHALGGVFASEHLARIAEGGKPEIVGDQDFMTASITRALVNIGGDTIAMPPQAAPAADDRLLGAFNDLSDKFDEMPLMIARAMKSSAMGGL